MAALPPGGPPSAGCHPASSGRRAGGLDSCFRRKDGRLHSSVNCPSAKHPAGARGSPPKGVRASSPQAAKMAALPGSAGGERPEAGGRRTGPGRLTTQYASHVLKEGGLPARKRPRWPLSQAARGASGPRRGAAGPAPGGSRHNMHHTSLRRAGFQPASGQDGRSPRLRGGRAARGGGPPDRPREAHDTICITRP